MNKPKEINKIISSLLETNGFLLFLLYCLVSSLFIFVNDEFVVTEQIYNDYAITKMEEKYDDYETLADEFEEDLETYQEGRVDWEELAFDFIFVTIQAGIQFGLISVFIYIGLIFAKETESIKYTDIFKLVLLCEFIFFIPRAIKYGWFILQDGYTFEDVRNFNPFSIYGLFDPSAIPEWLIYPLRFVNLFECVYLVGLVYGVSVIACTKTQIVSIPVTISYLSLMFLWIVVRIYISTIF